MSSETNAFYRRGDSHFCFLPRYSIYFLAYPPTPRPGPLPVSSTLHPCLALAFWQSQNHSSAAPELILVLLCNDFLGVFLAASSLISAGFCSLGGRLLNNMCFSCTKFLDHVASDIFITACHKLQCLRL